MNQSELRNERSSDETKEENNEARSARLKFCRLFVSLSASGYFRVLITVFHWRIREIESIKRVSLSSSVSKGNSSCLISQPTKAHFIDLRAGIRKLSCVCWPSHVTTTRLGFEILTFIDDNWSLHATVEHVLSLSIGRLLNLCNEAISTTKVVVRLSCNAKMWRQNWQKDFHQWLIRCMKEK